MKLGKGLIELPEGSAMDDYLAKLEAEVIQLRRTVKAKPLDDKRLDAALAGLRMLQVGLETGDIKANDGGIGEILTSCGLHCGMNTLEVDRFINDLQFKRKQLFVTSKQASRPAPV